MNWTRTVGAPALCQDERASTSTCRPCAITCSHVRAARRSPSSTCASSATTCALWPSPAACSRTRWLRGCAGAGRRGVCAWWCTAARADRDRQTAAARHPSRCWASSATAYAAAWRTPASRPGAWLQRTFTTGCCDGSTRAPRCSALGGGPERFYALARYPDSTEKARPARSELASGRDFSQRAVLWAAALGRGRKGLVLRRHAAPRADHRPAAHAARHRAPDRRDPQGRRDQHAVRPDARGHLDVSHDGRHAAGCPGIGSEPPGEEAGRDAGVGADLKDVHEPAP
ncbi:Uncharacterised protein [Pseudomonas aeruginosa]|nr:Uncharacterised protein [Pseudomonas aeruginosa]